MAEVAVLKAPITWLAGRVGAGGVPRLVGAAVVVMMVVAVVFSVTLFSGGAGDWARGIDSEVQSVLKVRDADGDGLPDAVENRIGSDVNDPTTLGEVPDGWIHHWYGDAVDWNDTSLLSARVLQPPPEELPAPLRPAGALVPPTLAELYAAEATLRDPDGRGVAWWTQGPVLDPLEWDNDGDGLADAWLFAHGLDPLGVEPDERAPGDASLSLQQKYEHGLDPTTLDSDADGLADAAELAGVARFGTLEVQFQPTNPAQSSSRGDGIPDGYIVRFGLDPHDGSVGKRSPAGDGLTVREAFVVTRDHCVDASPDGCDWMTRLADGPLVDPTRWDSLGDGVADAWSVRYSSGAIHPLINATQHVLFRTTAWDATPWDGDPTRLDGVVVDEANPRPDAPGELTARDLYTYQRPGSWDEASDGPWWGGLTPANDTGADSLPSAVALRGWDLRVDPRLGREPGQEGDEEKLQTVHAGADPRKTDTDGDGLSDWAEYFGVLDGAVFPRTSANDPDTDGDGLPDGMEVGPANLGTHPLRRDSSGSFLTDGQKFDLWTMRSDRASFGLDPSGLPASALAPGGDVDGDGVSNILDPDSDDDGLKDGQELLPNRFLAQGSAHERPATDPARADSDGDGLPDEWEVRWSTSKAHQCGLPCRLPQGTEVVSGWPLNPVLALSLRSTVDGVNLEGTDAQVNLANDRVRVNDGPPREFSNGLAYTYDLDPYAADSSPSDGIPDMFAIHWGVEQVPDLVADASLAWTLDKANVLASDLAKRDRVIQQDHIEGGQAVVVIDPARADTGPTGITNATDLLGIFTGRQKGTWTYTAGCDGGHMDLPDGGQRSEAAHARASGEPDGGMLPARNDLKALAPISGACWTWHHHPLSEDIRQGTSPWRHDTDDDGLPDAWEAAYDVQPSVSAETVLSSSLQSGCALGPAGAACLTHAQAYALGIDPSIHDTDDGGLADWLEVFLGLDPLNPSDDHGEEDWDGDGLSNLAEIAVGTDLLDPDSDGDGLLDGDLHGARPEDPPGGLPFMATTLGDGDLCLADPDDDRFADIIDEEIPSMPNRPAKLGGPLTHGELFAWYFQDLGIVHDPDPEACPDGHYLFKREAIADRDNGILVGSGASSDSLLRDTSGDGVPDGWLVYWRDRSGDPRFVVPLDPSTDTRLLSVSDPDDDLRGTPDEHGGPLAADPGAFAWGAPADWDEERDGTWWGGMAPTTDDTDADAVWYDSRGSADDLADPDLDNDGIPDRYDPYPAIDTDNTGIVQWNETEGRFVTNYTLLWAALDDRPDSSLQDPDEDLVPTFLDRVRVGATVVVPSTALQKNTTSVIVRGTVSVDEPDAGETYTDAPGFDSSGAADDGSAVANATVQVYLRDSTGREALAGVGFTNATGAFEATVRVSGSVIVPPCPPSGATVAGKVCPPGGTVGPVGTNALGLQPGPLSLRVEVEANDPRLQPIAFGATDPSPLAVAHKDAAPFFRIPDGTAPGSGVDVARVALNTTTGLPDSKAGPVRHAAEAIFPASSASVSGALSLHATTRIALDPLSSSILVGDDLLVAGTFADLASSTPLPDRTILIRVDPSGATEPLEAVATTDEAGRFSVTFPTLDLDSGVLELTVGADLDPDDPDDEYLTEPTGVEASVVLRRDTTWKDILVGAVAVPDGGEAVLPADAPLRVRARLVDHLGNGVASTATIDVAGLAGLGTVIGPTDLPTAPDGTLDANLGTLPPGLPLDRLRLTIEQEPTTSADGVDSLEIILKPLYATQVLITANGTADTADTAVIAGRLLRSDGTPVSDPAATIEVAGGEETLQSVGTNATGGFLVHVAGGAPVHREWTVRFIPEPGGLLTASQATAATTHTIATRIEVDPATGLRGEALNVTGRLLRSDGNPASGNVAVSWGDAQAVPVQVTASPDGRFRAVLESRPVGVHVIHLESNGTLVERPSQSETTARVLEPTRLIAEPRTVIVSSDGTATPTTLMDARLTDGNGTPLVQRIVLVTVTDPSNATAAVLELPTASDGSLRVTADDVEPNLPGNWSFHAHYAGGPLEATADSSVVSEVYHQVELTITRAPSEARPGEAVIVHGHARTAAEQLDAITIRLFMGNVPVGEATTLPGESWQIRFAVPVLSHGPTVLRASAHAYPDGVRILEAEATVRVVSGIDVAINETLLDAEGARRVQITALDHAGGAPVGGLEMVLLRMQDGRLVGTQSVTTDETGTAILVLDAAQAGNLTVAALRDADRRLESTSFQAGIAPLPSGGTPWWMTVAAVGAVLGAVVLAASFVLWRRRQRRSLQEAFDSAHRLLIDPNMSPSQVVERLYHHLLRILADAGDPVNETDTARTISGRVTRAFRLPAAPMQEMTVLFERAVYSQQELSQGDRSSALTALRRLTHALGAPLEGGRSP